MHLQSQPAHRRTQVRLVVLVTTGAAFMASLDLFVVNVAFDDIGASLGVGRAGGPSAADLSWVLNAYAVVFAALLVPFGRLADRYGRRTIFAGGLLVFVLASVACAASGVSAAAASAAVMMVRISTPPLLRHAGAGTEAT